MMAPDSQTRARVWKFPIAQNFFWRRPRRYAHSIKTLPYAPVACR